MVKETFVIGRVISNKTIEVDKTKVKVIEKLLSPTSRNEH